MLERMLNARSGDRAFTMKSTSQILAIVFSLTFVSAVNAQTPEKCAIEVAGPSSVEPGTPLVFKVKVTGKLPTATPEFKWWLSLGKD